MAYSPLKWGHTPNIYTRESMATQHCGSAAEGAQDQCGAQKTRYLKLYISNLLRLFRKYIIDVI